MRISELAAESGVAVATIKYYLREGLLPPAERTSATQAAYDARHAERLRVIKALQAAGVSIADVRRVVAALDEPPAGAFALYERLGGRREMVEPRLVDGIAHALATLEAADFTVPPDVLDAYVAAARTIAEREIAGIPEESPDDAVRYIVLGTVLTEPLVLALRRAAQQIVSSERYGPGGDAQPVPRAPSPR